MLVAISILAIIFTALSSAGSLALIYCAFTGVIPVATVITAIISAFISTIMLFALKKALEGIERLENILKEKNILKDTDFLPKSESDYGKWISKM